MSMCDRFGHRCECGEHFGEDHNLRAEVERLTRERDEARAESEGRLKELLKKAAEERAEWSRAERLAGEVERLRGELRALAVTISALRSCMLLPSLAEWAELEEAHNRACAAVEGKP